MIPFLAVVCILFVFGAIYAVQQAPSLSRAPAARARSKPHPPRLVPVVPAPSPLASSPLVEYAAALAPVVAIRPMLSPDQGEALRQKLRDRYIAARFPGVARSAADLEKIEQVVKAARLYFEEEKYDRALELLDMAIVQCPLDDAMPLARLELVFLGRGTARFVALAAEFRRARPTDTRWDEIRRLGRALDPSEPLFVGPDPESESMRYGPWPDMPNWIQASWDLTSEVRSADFHHAMAHDAARGAHLSQAN